MFNLECISYIDNGSIPTKYAHSSVRGGKNISPGFRWSGAPAGTKSFAFSIIDPHPVAKNWVHWFVIDIPANESSMQEGASCTSTMPKGSKELLTSYNEEGYGGPAPPAGSGIHPYVATVYALNISTLPLKMKTSREQFLSAMKGKVLGEATMTGYYQQ